MKFVIPILAILLVAIHGSHGALKDINELIKEARKANPKAGPHELNRIVADQMKKQKQKEKREEELQQGGLTPQETAALDSQLTDIFNKINANCPGGNAYELRPELKELANKYKIKKANQDKVDPDSDPKSPPPEVSLETVAETELTFALYRACPLVNKYQVTNHVRDILNGLDKSNSLKHVEVVEDVMSSPRPNYDYNPVTAAQTSRNPRLDLQFELITDEIRRKCENVNHYDVRKLIQHEMEAYNKGLYQGSLRALVKVPMDIIVDLVQRNCNGMISLKIKNMMNDFLEKEVPEEFIESLPEPVVEPVAEPVSEIVFYKDTLLPDLDPEIPTEIVEHQPEPQPKKEKHFLEQEISVPDLIDLASLHFSPRSRPQSPQEQALASENSFRFAKSKFDGSFKEPESPRQPEPLPEKSVEQSDSFKLAKAKFNSFKEPEQETPESDPQPEPQAEKLEQNPSFKLAKFKFDSLNKPQEEQPQQETQPEPQAESKPLKRESFSKAKDKFDSFKAEVAQTVETPKREAKKWEPKRFVTSSTSEMADLRKQLRSTQRRKEEFGEIEDV